MADQQDHTLELLARAERALAGKSISAAFGGVRAIIGPARFPAGEDLAQEGMDALRKGIKPTPAQIAALELVIKSLRPSILASRGMLGPLPPYQRYDPGVVARWETFRAAAKPLLYSIGRIDQITGGLNDPLATGFLVAPGVLITNTHVLDALTANTRQLQEGQAVVRFGQEYGVIPDAAPIPITGIIAVHPHLDMTLLSIQKDARPVLTIASEPASQGLSVVALGYPQDDPRSPVFRDVIFENKFGVKRGAPGEIRGTAPSAVFHDCSTLGGNSGSPLLDITTCQVVGLHRDGPLFLFRNEAVDGPAISDFVKSAA